MVKATKTLQNEHVTEKTASPSTVYIPISTNNHASGMIPMADDYEPGSVPSSRGRKLYIGK